MKEIKLVKSESFIDVYFKDKLILEITDFEYAIVIYDNISHSTFHAASPWLNGAFEEIQPYLGNLLKQLK